MTEDSEHPESSTYCETRSFVVSSGSNLDDEEQFYNDFRGSGAPSGELGATGDTYIDVDGNLLYARLADGWVRWPGPKKRSASLVHPKHSSLFLWCNMNKNLVSWMRKSKMKKIHLSATDVVLRTLAAHTPKSRKRLKRKHASEDSASDSDSDAKRVRVSTPTPTPAATAPAVPTALAWRRCHVESPIPTATPSRCPSAETPDQHLPPPACPLSDFAARVSPRRSPVITAQTSLPRAAVITNYVHTISSPILRWPETNIAPGTISGTASISPIVHRSSSDTSSGTSANSMVRPSLASPSVTASSGVTARSTSALSSSGRDSSMHVSPISPAQPLPLSLTPTLSPRHSNALPSSPLPSLGSLANMARTSMANPASDDAATQGLTNVAAVHSSTSVPTLPPRDTVRPMPMQQQASGFRPLHPNPVQDRLAPRAGLLEAASIQQWESDRLRSQGSWDTSKLHLQTQNNRLKIKNDEIIADREVLLGRLNDLLHQRNAWIREREASQRVARMTNLQITDLTKQNSSFKLLNIHLTGENTALKNLIRDLKISNATLSTKNATLAEQNIALRAENTERNNSLRRIMETIRRVKKDNEARKTRPEQPANAAGQHPEQDEMERSTGGTSSTAVATMLKENIVQIKEEQSEEPRVAKSSFQDGTGTEVIDLTLDSGDDGDTQTHRSDKGPPVDLVLSSGTRDNQKPPSVEQERKPFEDVSQPNLHPRINPARLLDTQSVLQLPTVGPSPSTSTHFLIAGTAFENRQLVELVMHKGGAHCVTQEIWGQILMHLELIARQGHTDFEVPRSSWRDTTIALRDHYLRYLLHLERSNGKDVSCAIAVTPASSRHNAPSIHPHSASPTVHQPQDYSANIAPGQHNRDAPSESLGITPAGDYDVQVADGHPQTATDNSVEVDNNAPAAEQTPGDPISNTITDEVPGIEPEATASHPRLPDDMAQADDNNEMDLREIEQTLRVETEDVASPVDESIRLLEHRDTLDGQIGTLDEQTGAAETRISEDPIITPVPTPRRLTQSHIQILWTFVEGVPDIICNPCNSVGNTYAMPSDTALGVLAEHSEAFHPDHCDIIVSETQGMTEEEIQEWLQELDADDDN
ncbi:hypothetical protein C8R47DRAFT_711765 [Mycena vitilis]|nr:hypothetical protein C8R47DRAFT_711765 [Mycena vitilis]